MHYQGGGNEDGDQSVAGSRQLSNPLCTVTTDTIAATKVERNLGQVLGHLFVRKEAEQ